ncbi:MAG: hypothetical protein ABIN57_00930 [Chitinophagaceae bacterium]
MIIKPIIITAILPTNENAYNHLNELTYLFLTNYQTKVATPKAQIKNAWATCRN